MPLPAYYRREDFDATPIGSLPTGFVPIGAAGFAVGTLQPATGARSLAPASNVDGPLVLVTSPAAPDGNHCVQFTHILTQPDSGNISRYDPILRAAPDGSYYYRVAVDQIGNGTNVLVTFHRYSGGSLTAVSGALVGGPILANGTRIWAKAEAQAGTLKYKQWAAGTAEPAGWQATQDDGSLGATGTFATGALYAHAGTPGIVGLDHFLAATAGTTFAASYTLGLSATAGASGAPVTATFTPDGVSDATVTPAAASVAGAWSPATVAFSGPGAITSQWTPSATGTATISGGNDGGLADPAGVPYTVTAAAPTAATLAGPAPASGATSAESAAWTITLNRAAPAGGTVVALASSEAGDAFHATPGGAAVTAIAIPAGQTVGTFLLRTDATTGSRTVTPTSAGIAFTPSTFSYTASIPATVVYTQDFDALPTGALADFALSGGANFVVGTTDPVSGTKSFGTATPANLMAAVATHAGGAAVNLVAEIEVYYEHIPHSPGGSGSAVFTPVLRADSGFTTGYWFAGNPVGATLNKRVGGVDSTRGGFVAFAGGNLLPDQPYNVRARAETQSASASRVRLKVWPHAQAEPTTWDYDFVDDTSPIAGPGYGGALVYDTSANVAPLAFDSFTVYDLTGVGGTPPASPLTSGGAPSQTGQVILTAVAPTGGSSTYTYQWHAATASGFTPASGNNVAGGTGLTLTVVQPLTTTFYVLVASDGTTSVAYPQVAVSGASAGSNAARPAITMNGGFQ